MAYAFQRRSGSCSFQSSRLAIKTAARKRLTQSRNWCRKSSRLHIIGPTKRESASDYTRMTSSLWHRSMRKLRPSVIMFQTDQASEPSTHSGPSSSAADAPRGMAFLYSPNRMNVASSRTKCLSLIVASPNLLEPACKSPDSIRLVNAICRFAELSS
jgi:hypothetical protein